jgi:hypothetical protein
MSLLAKIEKQGKVMPAMFSSLVARNSAIHLYTITIGLLIFLCMWYTFSFSYETNALEDVCHGLP